MKKLYILFITFFITAASFGQITINEIDYTGILTDFVELKGPVDQDLTGWTLVLYKQNGQLQNTIDLGVVIFNGRMPQTPNYNGETVQTWEGNLSSPGGYVLLLLDGVEKDFIAFGNGTQERTIGAVTSLYAGNSTTGNSLQLADGGVWLIDTPTPNLINTGQTLSVAKNQIAGFAMYPNPVTDGTFSITSNNSVEKNIEIFSVSGQQVYKSSVKSRENIDISNLTTGSYFIRVEEEGKTATRKLIVN